MIECVINPLLELLRTLGPDVSQGPVHGRVHLSQTLTRLPRPQVLKREETCERETAAWRNDLGYTEIETMENVSYR